MERYDYIVAIDPDVNESGVACLNVETRQLECSKQRFPAAIDLCIQKQALANDSGKRFVVVIESGWMNLPNWHIQGHNARAAAAIGKQTGRNHEVGRLLVEMLEHHGVPVELQMPLRKCWKGKDGKITAEELKAFTGYSGRSNQDERDAMLLAWNYANLPIRIVTTRR